MNFLLQFKPICKIAYLAIGFLFFHWLGSIFFHRIILILVFLLSCISFFRGYTKVFAITLGILLVFVQNFYFTPENFNSNLKEEEFELVKKNSPIKILFLKEIKRNFYETEIYSGELKFRSIVKRYKKDITLPTISCDSKYISIKKPPDNAEYFRFLRHWNYFYLQISESKCLRISEEIDYKKLLRKQVEDLLTRAKITDYANDIAMGLFFGDASYLDNEFKEKVREGGVLHLFAASGLHIGVFIAFLYFFSKQIWFFNYYTERIFPLVFAFSYIYFLGFPVSLLRAYIFTSILVLGSLFFRKMKSIDLILVSSALILLLDPENFLTLSFNLSYSAVCGILFLKNYLDKLLFRNWKNFFTENFTISISASLGTYPVLISYFYTFSFGSIFLNLLLVPLTSILLPLLYISLLAQILYEFLLKKAGNLVLFASGKNFCDSKSIFLFPEIGLQYATEIFWTYSELLLRTLAFLSEKLSESVGFYRGVKNSFSFHIGIYLVLFFLLCVSFLFIERKFFTDKQKTSNAKRVRISLSIFFFLLIISFFYFGYILFPEKAGKPSYAKNISAGSDYFLVKEGNEVHLGGICKYSQFQIQRILNQGFCDETIKSIFIEEESCLYLANICRKSTVNAKIYSAKKMDDWLERYSYLNQNTKGVKRKFSNLVIFYPHLDSLTELQKNARTDKGNILLLFAYKLNDNAKDWNENKNVLGINGNWNFITPDEL